jgi:coenzyme F420-0:L-glutamate ligase/coenzyme F420-1:gamma-L-glutamate ligase
MVRPPHGARLKEIRIIGLTSLPEIQPGCRLGEAIVDACVRENVKLEDGDVVVVTHKIVSKAEGRMVRLDDVQPSQFARRVARHLRKDPRILQLVLDESRRIVRMARGIVIAETRHGFICANAGVDQSNSRAGYAVLLPVDPDRSARRIRDEIRRRANVDVAVIISDTFGRPWRVGQVDVAIGVAGMEPLLDYRGMKDPSGYELRITTPAVADEAASAAELVMGKLDRIPVAIIKGMRYTRGESSARKLIRRASQDLFR